MRHFITFIYHLVNLPLVILEFIFGLIGEAADWIAARLSYISHRWLVRCRKWAGLNEEGLSKERIAMYETKRYENLVKMGSNPYCKSCESQVVFNPSNGEYYCKFCGWSAYDIPETRPFDWHKNEAYVAEFKPL